MPPDLPAVPSVPPSCSSVPPTPSWAAANHGLLVWACARLWGAEQARAAQQGPDSRGGEGGGLGRAAAASAATAVPRGLGPPCPGYTGKGQAVRRPGTAPGRWVRAPPNGALRFRTLSESHLQSPPPPECPLQWTKTGGPPTWGVLSFHAEKPANTEAAGFPGLISADTCRFDPPLEASGARI